MNFNQLKAIANECVFSTEGITIMKTEEYDYRLKQITQLTNNWNELEEYLKGLIDNFKEDVSTPILHEQLAIEMIYEYMQEIKGGDTNV